MVVTASLLYLLTQCSTGFKPPTKGTDCISSSSVHTDLAPDLNLHSFVGHTSLCVLTYLSKVGPSFGVIEPGWAFPVEAAALYLGWPNSNGTYSLLMRVG